MRGVIIDVDHDLGNREETIIRIFVRTEKGTEMFLERYEPYVYVIGDDLDKIAEKLRNVEGVTSAEKTNRLIRWEKRDVLLVRLKHNKYAKDLRDAVKEMGGECREHDIPVERKYLYERRITPMQTVEIEAENGWVREIRPSEGSVPVKIAAFDLEMYAQDRMPDPKRDEIIMASYVDSDGNKTVITTKKIDAPFVKTVETEEQIISELNRLIRENDPDIIFTYNGDAFDLPYLKERAHVLGLKIPWGRDGSEPRIRRSGGGNTTVEITGRAHVDVFQIIQFMAAVGAINTFKLDLENVYKTVLGREKVKIEHRDIAEVWRSGNLEDLALYNLQDSEACYELGMEFLPLYEELARITTSTLYNIVRMSTSQIVEWKLIQEAYVAGKIVPRKPKEEEVRARMMQSYAGAFVRQPIPGLHENIVVLDFRSLYPTIIISHNVDPDTVNAPYCSREEAYVSPVGHYFCKEPKGLLPRMLEEVLKERFALKDRMKKMDKSDPEYRIVYAKQQALKIIANSAYGYLGFARARWYSKECAEAITAWARKYIQDVMKKAEEFGFKVLYGDTDSVFLVLPEGWGVEKAFEFLEKINAELPKPMTLEFDGFYKRGIFLTRRGGQGAAKKKYALIDEKGNLKITGMEYVRRDWAEIAKEVQKRVLELVLGEGKPDKAVEYVRRIIDDIRAGKVPKEKLIIYTQIRRDLDRYEAKGPHVAAAIKAMRRGVKIEPGMIIGYVITRRGKSISDKAELAAFAEDGDYDPEYYIHNQVLPAVMPILEELGYTERDLSKGSAQKTLFDFT
ncbi:MAG: DNA polymerase [Candidatus Diapherotrites archaeon]|nr:DNA polymerase [Candidatus Diapherotrites archaeon]